MPTFRCFREPVKRMRITLTAPHIGPVRPGQGCIESLVLGWSAELARRGHEVTVASLSADGAERCSQTDDGCRTIEVRSVRHLAREADLVVANNRPHHLQGAFSVPRRVLFMHNPPSPTADNSTRSATPWPPTGRWDDRGATLLETGTFLESARSITGPWTNVACSRWLARRLEGLTGARSAVVYPHVDPAFPAAARAPRRQVPMLLYAGRLIWRKGLADLVGLCDAGKLPGRLLVTNYSDFASESNDEPQIRAMLVASGIPLVAAPRAPAAVAELMSQADVVLVPSSDEPFGLVAVEARAAGTPVVGYRSGGLPETSGADPTGLYLADHGDTLGLAEMANRALSSGPLPDRVRLAVASEFGVGRAVDRLLSVAEAVEQ
jgi:glycosyltransferase involved in cell wall biosynthesis